MIDEELMKDIEAMTEEEWEEAENRLERMRHNFIKVLDLDKQLLLKRGKTMRKINHIVIHCTATLQDATRENIIKYWQDELKWEKPGYHYLIDAVGQIHPLITVEYEANGVKGHNHDSIHVAYIGGVDQQMRPIDNRTDQQKIAMEWLIKVMIETFPDALIVGHCVFPGVKKDCPCFDVQQWVCGLYTKNAT